MKVKIHYLDFYSPLVNEKEQFVLISDIHSDSNKLEQVYKIIDEIKPSFVTIPGDILDYINDPRNKVVKQILEYQGSKYPTFITMGNHDTIDYGVIGFSAEEILVNDTSFFDDLNKSNFTVFKDNVKSTSIGNINIHGMSLSNEWYQNGESREVFFDNLKTYELNPDKLDIMLFHTPNGIIDRNGNLISENQTDTLPNLIVTGHTHGGLVPDKIQRIMPSNRGFIGPYDRILPKHAFGVYNDHNSSLVISDGITKFHDSGGGKYFAAMGDIIYHSDLYVITISPKKDLDYDENYLVETETKFVKKR